MSGPSVRPLSQSGRGGMVGWLGWAGWRRIRRFLQTLHRVGSFALITLGVMLSHQHQATCVIHPQIRRQIVGSGLKLLPMTFLVGAALGVVIIGQTIALLSRVGAEEFIGTIMVSVVIRELGPLATALMVLARVGTRTVIELGTSRAAGEVEALEALGIDPIRYLVLPRVAGLSVAIFSLTVYLILTALVVGYLFAFVENIPLVPGEYFRQLADALYWQDFLLLALKTLAFGGIIGVVSCYQGLAAPLSLRDVPKVTTAAVVQSVVACVLLDALFIVLYLLF